jgi:class 3 adenylate cyclase
MTDPSASGPMTHGFLFADLRGYTAYAEARGDLAAADLIDRYRLLVRGVVEELGGAEIKTEGDSFYVVFPSASRAVAAGLAIVDRATRQNEVDPTDPIQVGVGIHAGEAEQRLEGYVGTAVNIAARVCAQARPGEVLVTDTVRSLTRTSGRYRYVARGRPALKGIAEPVGLFAAEDASTEPGARARTDAARSIPPWLALIGVVAVVVIVAALAIWSGALGPRSSPAPRGDLERSSASPGVSPTRPTTSVDALSPPPSGPQAFHTGPLAAGTYRSTLMEPAIEFTVPDGWNGIQELPNYLEIDRLGDDGEQLAFMVPSVGYVPCSLTEFETLPSDRESLVAWLRADKGLSVRVVGTVKLGSVEAQQLDVGLGNGCKGQSVQRLFLIQSDPKGTHGDERWVVTPGPPMPVYAMNAGDRSVVAMVGSAPSKLDRFVVDARTVLSSLRIGP